LRCRSLPVPSLSISPSASSALTSASTFLMSRPAMVSFRPQPAESNHSLLDEA
jgi:hypothetical protein